MNMFCYQCQETLANNACTKIGVCGKKPTTSNLQDTLIHLLKSISICIEKTRDKAKLCKKYGPFITRALFTTITNANFDDRIILSLIDEALKTRNDIRSAAAEGGSPYAVHPLADWCPKDNKLGDFDKTVSVLNTKDEDIRSLRELVIYGLKGIAAYTEHAYLLGFSDASIYDFIVGALASVTLDLGIDELVSLTLRTGETAIKAMALLDKANTSTYGNPEITKVNIGVRNNPGILISGHDLKDMEELLKQTEGTGIDIYTHCEMLPANYYPAFKKYGHFAGNYGNSWWEQNKEFESFNGPILMTTNCLVPVKDTYKYRLFTTGVAGYPGVRHIPAREGGRNKDFSELISLAKQCEAPVEIETGYITGGFAHAQIFALADKIIAAVKTGAIKRFVVMAGCDGRQSGRSYFTEVAEHLPPDTVILTAGCAKYRYNKLKLGDIDGIPRIIDAGQCNDSYSLAIVALKLKEIVDVKNVNELPIVFDLAWYEQKAVAVLIALLFLGFKNIKLGPTLPAFLSPNITKVLVENFGISPTTDAGSDIAGFVSDAPAVDKNQARTR